MLVYLLSDSPSASPLSQLGPAYINGIKLFMSYAQVLLLFSLVIGLLVKPTK